MKKLATSSKRIQVSHLIQQGFTLAELLISGAIFATLAIIAVTIFVNVARSNNRINIEDQIYTEAHILMEKLAREIRKGTIDFEEYHNQKILNGEYGEHYGDYAKKFYDPGITDLGDPLATPPQSPTQDTGFGQVCADDISLRYDPKCGEEEEGCSSTCIPYSPSQDTDSGQNPFEGVDDKRGENATAFCDEIYKEPLVSTSGAAPCDTKPRGGDGELKPEDFEGLHFQDALYLINANGDQKTLIGRELINESLDGDPDTEADNEYALSLVRLQGEDRDSDNIRETWFCLSDFLCTLSVSDILGTPIQKPSKDDLASVDSSLGGVEIINGEDFIPLTPSSINVTSLKFLIAPLEDPHKAFFEDYVTQDYIYMQPVVTIILTVKPAYKEAVKLFRDPKTFPEITLQTTISARVYDEVKSF